MGDFKYKIKRNGKFIIVPPIDEVCEMLKEKFSHQEEENHRMQEEINSLKSGVWADEQMAKMKKQYEEMKDDYYRGFPISESEKKVIRNWETEHEKVHPGGHGVSGGKYTYEFIPTSIGTIGYIKCVCGEKFCFQDL